MRARVGILVTLLSLLAAACAGRSMNARGYRGEAFAALHRLAEVRALEERDPTGAIRAYEEVLEQQPYLGTFESYRGELADNLEDIEANPRSANLTPNAALGFPSVYVTTLRVRIDATAGLSRAHLAAGDAEAAEDHAREVIRLAESGGLGGAASRASVMHEGHELMAAARRAQGREGMALVSQLNADLAVDYARSVRGVEGFYREQAFLQGDAARAQIREVDKFIGSVNDQRAAQDGALAASVTASVVGSVNTSIAQINLQNALHQSGGAVTPQVQMAQLNVQLAQIQAGVLNNMAMAAQVRAGNAETDLTSTPWGIATFAEQLGDPSAGVDTLGIVQRFAGSASQLTADPEIVNAASEVSSAALAIGSARDDSRPEVVVATITSFANALNGLVDLLNSK